MSSPLVRPKKPNTSPLKRSYRKLQRPGGFNSAEAIAKKLVGPTEDNTAYTEFNLRACDESEVENTRYHIMRFHSRVPIEPTKTFAPPLRLSRKNPKSVLNGEKQDANGGAASDGATGGDTEDARPAPAPKADMSVVAPDGGARKMHRNPFQKKTRQVMTSGRFSESARKLRYEENFPWVLEDFEDQNTWVGNYEAAQSDTFCLFFFEKDGFKMIPAEKWYKFTPRNKFKTLSLDDAEARMKKKESLPRWFMKDSNNIMTSQPVAAPTAASRRRLKTVDGGAEITRDRDELDFEDEFADDEEAPVMEGNEEDVKEVEEKIKKEQSGGAEIMTGDAHDDDDDDLFNEAPKIDKEGRRVKKYLKSLEKNTYYDSDDENANPYLSEEDKSDESDFDNDVDNNDPQGQGKGSNDGSGTLDEFPRKIIVKKDYPNLPPGVVILQMQPSVLARFPRDVWNPNVKRRAVESPEAENPSKRVRIAESPSLSPPGSGSAGGATVTPGSVSPVNDVDLTLLTEDDIRNVIINNRVSARELLAILKPKLRLNPINNERVKEMIKNVARLSDGVLVLKE